MKALSNASGDSSASSASEASRIRLARSSSESGGSFLAGMSGPLEFRGFIELLCAFLACPGFTAKLSLVLSHNARRLGHPHGTLSAIWACIGGLPIEAQFQFRNAGFKRRNPFRYGKYAFSPTNYPNNNRPREYGGHDVRSFL